MPAGYPATMRQQQFVKTVVLVLVIGMVLTLGVGAIAALLGP